MERSNRVAGSRRVNALRVGIWSVALAIASWIQIPVVWAERPANIVIVMADDLGFSDLGCYGSEIATPVLDAFASRATVFANFHAAPTCSPTRAMLLTGVDHHRAGMGNMYEFLTTAPSQIGQPGYEGCLNDSVVTIAEVLKGAGYHTAISGKWHLGQRLTTSQAPVGRGFDDSWVLWAGSSEHYQPRPFRVFVAGNQVVPYPVNRYSTEWYTDQAIEFADHAIDQEQPFFLFVSYTAPHWPLEAPAELIAKQRGNYDDGYDQLRRRRIQGLIDKRMFNDDVRVAGEFTRRPVLQHDVPFEPSRAWEDLDADEQAFSSRLMEVHAAMVEAMDQQIGRLFRHLRECNAFDNSLIIFLSDNGAAPAASPFIPGYPLDRLGRPGSSIAYGPEWARASSGPLRLMKGHSTEGGTRVPAIIKLPDQNRHRLTHEFASVMDIAPTIYQLTGAEYPYRYQERAIGELQGRSMLTFLDGKTNRIHGKDDGMGWELFGRAAYRRGQWKIVWIEEPFGNSDFELFNIEADPGESIDLRNKFPDVYARLLQDFESYARDNGVIIVRPRHWQP